jgi:hypothetical protein
VSPLPVIGPVPYIIRLLATISTVLVVRASSKDVSLLLNSSNVFTLANVPAFTLATQTTLSVVDKFATRIVTEFPGAENSLIVLTVPSLLNIAIVTVFTVFSTNFGSFVNALRVVVFDLVFAEFTPLSRV